MQIRVWSYHALPSKELPMSFVDLEEGLGEIKDGERMLESEN